MRLVIVAVGRRMPQWIDAACEEFTRRVPPALRHQIIAVEPAKRGTLSLERLLKEEGDRLLAAAPADAHLIALDRGGRERTTEDLARDLGEWRVRGRDVAFLVGGADGLCPQCLARVDDRWSLSRLTLPHALARLVVVEQLYRAYSILEGLPYHK